MEKKTNQLIIQRVENGFIITSQNKDNISLFGGNQIDKLHHVATNIKDLNMQLNILLPELKTEKEIKDLNKKKEEEENE